MRQKFIYFLRPVGMEGPVKIGCSEVPAMRLLTYNRLSPFPLEIAATIPGGTRAERQFHALFRHLHSHHEWFKPGADLSAVIAEIAAGTFDPATLPQARNLPRVTVTRSPESLENQSLRLRLTFRLKAMGLTAPPRVNLAERRLSNDPGPERDEAVALIKACIADPMGQGATISEHRWAQERRAAWLAKQADPHQRAA